MRKTVYDQKYQTEGAYWGNEISKMALSIPNMFPPGKLDLDVLDIGCGEGTNSVFFAKCGYRVSAFDLSTIAVQKTNACAEESGVSMEVFQEDINHYLPQKQFDIVFSSGTLQYLNPASRQTFISLIKKATKKNGVHVLHTFAASIDIAPAPDAEPSEILWRSGELLEYYCDWRVERFVEEIKPCYSSGLGHEHYHSRIWARKLNDQ